MKRALTTKGFTLIELLAVLVILAVILTITVPAIGNVIQGATKNAFKSDAKMLVNAISNKQLEDDTFDPTTVSVSNIESLLGLSAANYDSIVVTNDNNKIHVTVVGKGKWNGLSVCGDRLSMTTGSSDSGVCATEDANVTPASCFTFDSGTKTITKYTPSSTCPNDVVIPNMIGGVNVENIGPGAFTMNPTAQYCMSNSAGSVSKPLSYVHTAGDGYSYCYYYNSSQGTLTSVKFPKYLKSVGYSAFQKNALTSVDFSNATALDNIGAYAFSNNAMTSAIIPNSVSNIEPYAFAYNKIASVNIPDHLTKINNYTFLSNYITSISIPNTVTSIGDHAFDSNRISSLTLPSNITYIGKYAFIYNKIAGTLNIPQSITAINDSAFANNQLTGVTIPSSVTQIGSSAFVLNKISSVVIPDSVTSVGEYAFMGNLLATITLSNKLTAIKANTFYDNRLTSVTIPSGVKSIENMAFANNYYLKSLSLPSSLLSIGDSAFIHDGLTSVTLPNSLTTISPDAFAYTSLSSINIPNSVTTIGQGAFNFNQSSNITIGTGLSSLGELPPQNSSGTSVNPFANSGYTNSISIDENNPYYKSMPDFSVILSKDGSTLFDIGDSNALGNLVYISNVEPLTKINAGAFEGNNGSGEVIIPSGVTTIGAGAFAGNDNFINTFSNIYIPETVVDIGDNAFAKCQIDSVQIEGDGMRFNSRWTNIGFPSGLMPQ